MSWTHRGNDDRKFLTTSVVAEMKDLSKRSIVYVTLPTKSDKYLEIIILLEITFTAKVGAEFSPR